LATVAEGSNRLSPFGGRRHSRTYSGKPAALFAARIVIFESANSIVTNTANENILAISQGEA
jgi:hypothetical protein